VREADQGMPLAYILPLSGICLTRARSLEPHNRCEVIMALIKKKTRKRLTKQVRKLVKKHGSEVVTGLVTGALTAAAAKFSGATDDSPKKDKKHKGAKPRSVSVSAR
jgi:hypothetical protein